MNFQNARDAAQYIFHNASKYAEAKAKRVYLEQFRKSKKALLIAEAEEKGRKTAQERESYAYAHKDYLEVLKGLQEAVEVEETLKWKLESSRIATEIWRTEQANNRHEMRAGSVVT